MATVTVLDNEKPYYKIRVSFNGLDFEQNIISSKTGAALQTQLQGYADEYETSYAGPHPDVIDAVDKTV